MKIKRFNENKKYELDPYNEENWNDLVKPELKHDPELITPLMLYMEKVMTKLESEEWTMQENFTDIYDTVFDLVVSGLYGDGGIKFIKKAWKIEKF
jgi:hypothetical protein